MNLLLLFLSVTKERTNLAALSGRSVSSVDLSMGRRDLSGSHSDLRHGRMTPDLYRGQRGSLTPDVEREGVYGSYNSMPRKGSQDTRDPWAQQGPNDLFFDPYESNNNTKSRSLGRRVSLPGTTLVPLLFSVVLYGVFVPLHQLFVCFVYCE